MGFASVIKYEGDNKTFVWRHPEVDFNTGTYLIVHESQKAIFMLNGEILETFGPGQHILETQNIPFIKRILKPSTNGENAFHAECYFVNLTEQMAIRWGTDSKIEYLDPEYQFPISLGACGEMSLAVDNAVKLMVKVVGTEKNLSQEQLTLFFRAFLRNRIKSIIPKIIIEKNINVFALDQYISEISDDLKTRLADDFYDYGIELRSFLITNIVKPEEDRNFIKFKNLHYRMYTDVAEAELEKKIAIIEQRSKAEQMVIDAQAVAKKRELEGYTYQQEKGFEVAKEIAKNDAVAQLNNVGIGMGLMAGVGASLGGEIGQMTMNAMNQSNERMKCGNCGHILPKDAVFCDRCGTKVIFNGVCTNCGTQLSNDSVFCPKCGVRRS